MNKKSIYGLGNTQDSNNTIIVEVVEDNNNEVLAGVGHFEEKDQTEENIFDNMDMASTSTGIQDSSSAWKNYCPANLAEPVSKKLRLSDTRYEGKENKKINSSRRRPTASVIALTTSQVAEKYNSILDLRRTLVQKQIELTELQILSCWHYQLP